MPMRESKGIVLGVPVESNKSEERSPVKNDLPHHDSPEYHQVYLANKKMKSAIIKQILLEDKQAARADGQPKTIDDRVWQRDFQKWRDDQQKNVRPGPHPYKDHVWNTHPEIFDIADSDEESDKDSF